MISPEGVEDSREAHVVSAMKNQPKAQEKKVEETKKEKGPPQKQAVAAKPGAKTGPGGEVVLAAYESPLPLSTGGVESMVILAD